MKRNVTDRAKRYRAQKNRPPGPRLCNFCSSRKNVDIDHISGNEAEGEIENLIYLCRSCNVSKGVTQARNKIGVRTAQFNPQKAANFSQFKNFAAILVGKKKGNAAKATAAIRATPPRKREEYALRIAKNPPPDFKQYVRGVVMHQRGAHDEGGTIIHATPPALRSEYAREIAALKASRRGKMKSMNPERRNLSDRQYREMKAMLAELTPAERRTLADPDFITEDEADNIVCNRRKNEPTIPAEVVLRRERARLSA